MNLRQPKIDFPDLIQNNNKRLQIMHAFMHMQVNFKMRIYHKYSVALDISVEQNKKKKISKFMISLNVSLSSPLWLFIYATHANALLK